jgi:DnaJ-class molecular chaperone
MPRGVLLPIRDTPARLARVSVVGRRIVGMRTVMICERCDGTGADPRQHDEEVLLCIECSGDGCHVTYVAELQLTA